MELQGYDAILKVHVTAFVNKQIHDLHSFHQEVVGKNLKTLEASIYVFCGISKYIANNYTIHGVYTSKLFI